MRLTTSTATLAVAGVAALATGCSSSGPSAAPVVRHHVKPAAVAKPAARHLTPRQELAQAARASLRAHSAAYRELETIVYVKAPTKGVNISPILTTKSTGFSRTREALWIFLFVRLHSKFHTNGLRAELAKGEL